LVLATSRSSPAAGAGDGLFTFLTAANMSNLAALIMAFALMYLISRLPRPSYVILLPVSVYFGFFFLNFPVSRISPGHDLSLW
jgi:hypothetical protein